MKTNFVNTELVHARIKQVIDTRLLNEAELVDIAQRVEEDMILEKAKEIEKKRKVFKEPSYNGVF